MKITPIEIRQQNFEKKLRGYDKDEVTAFLISLSNEWERLLDGKKELRIKLDQSEKEVQKLREVESSLFKTLKTAEDTGANMVDQANKAAKLHLKETQMNAEAMMKSQKWKPAKSLKKCKTG
jgi:cell division initiation protein